MLTEVEIDFIVRDGSDKAFNVLSINPQARWPAIEQKIEHVIRTSVRAALKKAGESLVEIGNGRHR